MQVKTDTENPAHVLMHNFGKMRWMETLSSFGQILLQKYLVPQGFKFW